MAKAELGVLLQDLRGKAGNSPLDPQKYFDNGYGNRQKRAK